MIDVQRKELKYIINQIEMIKLKKRLDGIMVNDIHNGFNGYRVRSLYFDTLSDWDFESKIDGYDRRQKIRIRVYDDNAKVIKLELKAKESDRQKKSSLILSKEEAESMVQGNYTFLLQRPEKIASVLYTKMVLNCYRPKCIVEYNRYAYIRDINDIRVTFDSNLRATESNLNIFDNNIVLYSVSRNEQVTMEVKYNQFLFSYIKQEISKIDKQQISNSKYCRARMITKRGRY